MEPTVKLKPLFNEIAAAIHDKDGLSDSIPAYNFPERIRYLPSGDGLYFQSLTMSSPNKTVFYAGETPDFSGMNPVLLLNDGSRVYQTNDNSVWTPAPGTSLGTDVTEFTLTATIDGITKSASQPITVIATYTIGVMWDYSQPSPELTRLTPGNDPYHYVTLAIEEEPVSGVSSPFDFIPPWSGMKEYNVINNSVSYSQDDPSFSRTDYETVVHIPEFYYCVKDDATNQKRYWYVSKVSKPGFSKHPGSNRYIGKYHVCSDYTVCSGKPKLQGAVMETQRTNLKIKLGSKWYPLGYDTHCAIALLYLVEYANFDIQAKIGNGSTCNSINTGRTDSLTYHTGQVENGVMYRWIEDFWGYGRSSPIDGLVIDDHVYVCTDPNHYENSIGIEYYDTECTLPTDGYIKNLFYSSSYQWMFLPQTVGGSYETYTTDYLYSSSGNAARLSRPTDKMNGLWYFDSYGRNTVYYSPNEISRAMYVP